MALELIPWDRAEGLNSEEEIFNYVEAALEENDPTLFAHVLGVVARARGIKAVGCERGD
jgi:probable addiction module antidote protein